MKRDFCKFIGTLLSLVVVFSLNVLPAPQPVMADDVGEVVDLVLSPTNQTVNPGETLTIVIEVQCNGQDVTGISAFLDFEADCLEVLSVTPGSTLPVVLQNIYDNSAGTIDYSAGKLGRPFENNTFTLAIISFKATGVVSSTPIIFHATGIRTTKADYGGASKLNNTAGATVTVVSGTSTSDGTTTPLPEPEPGITDVSSAITAEGVFTKVTIAQSEDEACKLTIDKGTIALTKDRKPIGEIIITGTEGPPAPPQRAKVLSPVYNLGPDGATFEPPITLTVTYAPGEIPQGIEERELAIACWNAEAGEWVELVSNVDTNTNTVTASVQHFTAFAILGYETVVEPAAFNISSLNISPPEVGIGEEITIIVSIANTGGEAGSYQVTLKINGVPEASKHVTVDEGSSQEVSFATSKDTVGNYSVDVNGLTGSFKVGEEAISSMPPEDEEGAAPSPTPSSPPPVPPAPQAKPINWPMLWGVIGGVIVVGILIFLVARRRPY